MTVDAGQAAQVMASAQCLYDEQQVEHAIIELAEMITESLGDQDPLILCVMNGGLVLTGKLMTRLDFPLTLDYIHATRYGREINGGQLKWLVSPHTPLQAKTVLIVDDILDEGATLAAIMEYCQQQGASQVYSAVLVEKLHDRKHSQAHADFIALRVEDRYVFGYGMDYKGRLRNAAGIYAVSD